MLNCKVPGYDDITFGDRLWVKSKNDLYRARIVLKPSLEKSPDGTIIHRGFPNAERIIMRAAARNSRSLLLADELNRPSEDNGSYNWGSFNPMACPDKGNTQAWGKVGFTLHPVPKQKWAVRRKWNELEKLQPKWGASIARREAAERNRQEQRAAAYIRANGNAAGCFRVEGGVSPGNQVNVGTGKSKSGEGIEASQIFKPRYSNNGNDNATQALRDIENAVASDSDSVYDTAIENAVESDSGSDSEVEHQSSSDAPSKRRESLSARTAYSSRQQKRPEVNPSTALMINRSATSPRLGVEATACDDETAVAVLGKRRVVRFDA